MPKKTDHHHHKHDDHGPEGKHFQGELNGIVIPSNVVETLLVCQSQSNRVGVAAVCQEIREYAQDQNPDKFPR